MGVLAPLFLGGLALLVVPFLIHRIRRPERETVRFGSLMFVPDAKHEVIERRRVQHVLLMLLRMALLALLALAFMRPYREVLPVVAAPKTGATLHAIVLDASLSMAASGRWEAAKKQALAVLASVKPGDRVGVVVCGRAAEVAAPLSGDVKFAREAIAAASVTWEKGDFSTALQAAEQMLSVDAGADVRRVIHLVSDFQASGMPQGRSAWRLPATVALDAQPVGADGAPNASVDALAVRSANDSLLQVRARVKTWSGDGAVQVRLVVDGKVMASREMTVPAGNASQAVFAVPRVSDALSGSVEVVGSDALERDNRRFFAWQADPPHAVMLLRPEAHRAVRSYDRLILAAVPSDAGLPWRVTVVTALAQALPEVVIAGDVTSAQADRLLNYAKDGGRVFLPLVSGANVDALNRLLAPAGVHLGAPRFAHAQPARAEPLVWVDLAHRIFLPFKGARFNDFSPVRVSNYYTATVDSPAVVIARLDDGAAAMVDAPLGAGRVVVWTGGVELDWSNLARTPRFVPLLHETLRYLAGRQADAPVYAVGDPVPEKGATPVGTGEVVGGRFATPGVYRWANGRLGAVNVDAAESDPARVSPAELEIRLAQAPVLYRGTAAQAAAAGAQVERREFGHIGIVLMFGLLLLEQWVAARLRTQQKETVR